MFTGIIEHVGKVVHLEIDKGNLNIGIQCDFSHELKIDQSVSHNGVCLTVVNLENNVYSVTAIDETIRKSNLGELHIGDPVNLERGLKLGDRLDGHIVQGHVDQTGECLEVIDMNGSWLFKFRYDSQMGNITIPKGSITVNGVSLTVVDSEIDNFSVAIIPHTYNHTNFNAIKAGSTVNLEFDVIGKYVSRIQNISKSN